MQIRCIALFLFLSLIGVVLLLAHDMRQFKIEREEQVSMKIFLRDLQEGTIDIYQIEEYVDLRLLDSVKNRRRIPIRLTRVDGDYWFFGHMFYYAYTVGWNCFLGIAMKINFAGIPLFGGEEDC